MQQRDKERLFLARSIVTPALFPGEHDLGVRLHGGWRMLRDAMALMNGAPLGDKRFRPARPQPPPGRARPRGRGPLPAGGGADRRRPPGCVRARVPPRCQRQGGQPAWKDANGDGVAQAGELMLRGARAATPSQISQRDAVGGDLQLRVRLPWLGVRFRYGELVAGANLDRGVQPADPYAAGRGRKELGDSVGVPQELTRWGMIVLRSNDFAADRDAPAVPGSTEKGAPRSNATLAVT